MMQIRLAWRNLWRNPRRTSVILAAVVLGVWAMVVFGALMEGMMDQMVRNAVSTLTGNLQIQAPGFRDDPVVQNRMPDASPARLAAEKLAQRSDLKWAPRVRLEAVAQNARHTAGVTLVGIEADREKDVSFLGEAVVEGEMLPKSEANAILVGRALLEDFATKPGNKLILMSQDANGEIASRAFRIRGVFETSMEANEMQYVFVHLAAAQEMLEMGDGLTEVVLVTGGTGRADAVAAQLKAELPADGYRVYTFRELVPWLRAYMEIFGSYLIIWNLVVFVAMGFGLVNTMLMAVFERMREFGLLKALGMVPRRILGHILTESLFLLALGMLAGSLLSWLTVLLLAHTGIDISAFAEGTDMFGMSRVIYPRMTAFSLLAANLMVLVLGLLVCLYPAWKAARFTPVEAMRQT